MHLETESERRASRLGSRWRARRVEHEGIYSTEARQTVKWARLSCGHTVLRLRRPGLGALIVCEQCARGEPCPGSSGDRT